MQPLLEPVLQELVLSELVFFSFLPPMNFLPSRSCSPQMMTLRLFLLVIFSTPELLMVFSLPVPTGAIERLPPRMNFLPLS